MITVRPTELSDAEYLTRWLLQPGVLAYFPMYDVREVEDAVRIWISYSNIGACLTTLWNDVPCGIATLYIQPFKKLAHQCLFSIVVDEEHRGKGVGKALMRGLMNLAKEKFGIEILHLEVYEGNPAIHLYRKMGFKEYGKQNHFIKEQGKYTSKIFMQRDL